MTVKELKESLAEYPEDMEVSFDASEGSDCIEYFVNAMYHKISEHSGNLTLYLYQE